MKDLECDAMRPQEGAAIVGGCLSDSRCLLTHLDLGNNSLKSVRLISNSATVIVSFLPLAPGPICSFQLVQ